MSTTRTAVLEKTRISALSLLLAGPVLAGPHMEEPASTSARGQALYEANCTLCHGRAGAADGPAAYFLFPPARDFTRGAFKLASTANAVPTGSDLVATLRRGIPGSAMPAWSWMPEEDLLALVAHVRELAVLGLSEDLGPEGAERARERMRPAEPVDVGAPVELTAEARAQGELLFLRDCAACHGDDGQGRPDTLRRNADGTFNWARDFTAGILRGGARHEDIARRIQVGLHGTAMPGGRFSAEDRDVLVSYVRSLIPEGAEQRLVQRRSTLRAERSAEPLKASLYEADWRDVPSTRIVLSPLWWMDDAIHEMEVSALHDGTSLAIRLRWTDATPNVPLPGGPPYKTPPYADAVALQVSSQLHPPYFGMGSGLAATNIWHWRGVELSGVEEIQSAFALFPHRMGEWLAQSVVAGMPLVQHARGAIHVADEVVAATPAGMQHREEQEQLPGRIHSSAAWQDGAWEVVLMRPLAPRTPIEIGLEPGSRVALNFAIWNGAIRDLRGQKSVTIWHELVLAP